MSNLGLASLGLADLGFNHANYLWLLLLFLPVTFVLWWFCVRTTIQARLAYGEEKLSNQLSRPLTWRSQLPALALWQATVLLLTVALSGPSLAETPQTAKVGSLQVMVTWDVSHSMGAEDYQQSIPEEKRAEYFGGHGNRLDMAKYVVETQIMPAITGNKLGFETYKGKGFNQAPLTSDYEPLRWVLRNWVRIGQAPCCGSDYGEGLQGAVDAFDNNDPHTQKVIVLFSDGGYTGDESRLATVLQELKEKNIRLVVLGLGTRRPVKVPQYDYQGRKSGYLQVDGRDAYTQIDESQLRRLTAEANGEYHHVDAHGISSINWPEALAGKGKTELVRTDLYKIPLLLAALCILTLSVLSLLQNRQETLAALRACRARGWQGNLDLLEQAWQRLSGRKHDDSS